MVDVWAVCIMRGTRRYVGKKTGRFYGHIGGGMLMQVDALDVEADPTNWQIASDQSAGVYTAAALGRKVLMRRMPIGTLPLTPPDASARRVLSRSEILARAQDAWNNAQRKDI